VGDRIGELHADGLERGTIVVEAMKGTVSPTFALVKDPNKKSIAATLILNDDVDGAESGLAQGTSTFHKVCAV
jgi:hypothetical protein